MTPLDLTTGKELEEARAQAAVLTKGYQDIVRSFMLDKCRTYHLRRKPENRRCYAYGCQDLSRILGEMEEFGKHSHAKARALLDRLQEAEQEAQSFRKQAECLSSQLQRAEAVVEAAKKWAVALTTSTGCIPGYSTCPGGDHRHLSQQEQDALMVLVGLTQKAAWEEGTA